MGKVGPVSQGSGRVVALGHFFATPSPNPELHGNANTRHYYLRHTYAIPVSLVA